MITLDEEIVSLSKSASKSLDYEWQREQYQIAKWLEELKFLKQWKLGIMDSFCKYDASSFEELIANARNKAIDDFVKEFIDRLRYDEAITYVDSDEYLAVSRGSVQTLALKIAEQLKAGGENV